MHCEAPTWEETDWPQLLELYSLLAAVDPSPVVLLSRAIVLGEVRGPAAALLEVDALEGALATYHRFHATRASLLRRLDRSAEARRADTEALRYTANPAERAVVSARLES